MAAEDNLSVAQFPGYNTANAQPEMATPMWSGLGMWGGPRATYGDYLSGNISQLSGVYAEPGRGVNGESSN